MVNFARVFSGRLDHREQLVSATTGQKLELRRECKKFLAGMSEVEKRLRSAAACTRLIDTPGFQSAKVLLLFIPTEDEIDLGQVFDAALEHRKKVCMPRMDWPAKTMAPVHVSSRTFSSEVRMHGIREPAAGPLVPLDRIDLVLVPGLAFDLRGYRLGRGGGFYDRFLAAYRKSKPRNGAALGVCFEGQIVPEVPADAHDKAVDGLVTESRLVLCRRARKQADKSVD